MFGGAVANDLRDITKAFVFLLCEIALVVARRTPVGKGTIRKMALRCRPYVAPSEDLGDAVERVATPASARTARRTLREVQQEHQLLLAGCRRMGKCRLPGVRRRQMTVLYNPIGRGDCCFSALRFMLRGVSSARSMRATIKKHAVLLLASGKHILNGRSLGEHLTALGISEEAYLRRLHGRKYLRWGNTLDIAVAADLWARRIQVINFEEPGYPVVMDTGGLQEPLVMGYARSHFFVVKRAKGRGETTCRTWRSWLAGGLLAATVMAMCVWPKDFYVVAASGLALSGQWTQSMTSWLPKQVGSGPWQLFPWQLFPLLGTNEGVERDSLDHGGWFLDGGMQGRDMVVLGDEDEGDALLDDVFEDGAGFPYEVVGRSIEDQSLHTIRSRESLQTMTARYVQDFRRVAIHQPVAPSYERISEDEKVGRPFLGHVLMGIHRHFAAAWSAAVCTTPRVCPPNTPGYEASRGSSLSVEWALSSPSTPGNCALASFGTTPMQSDESGESLVDEGIDLFTGIIGQRSEDGGSPGPATPGPHHLGERTWSNPASLRPLALEYYIQAMREYFDDMTLDSPPIFHDNGAFVVTEKLLLLHQRAQEIALDPVFWNDSPPEHAGLASTQWSVAADSS
eukprot:6485204-Amphidinium_carterae.1